MDMQAEKVGKQFGNYRLLELLGKGSFAEVYLGEHQYLKSHAALKILHTQLSDDGVARFLAEGQILARLTHPQIVRVHDFAVEQGAPFLVMDYAPKGTLRQQHPRGSCLSLDKVVAYTKQVAAALQYAHNHNVIHRDVKPENMLLGTDRQVLLSDFGLALFASPLDQHSIQDMAGTLPYMAPEQMRGKPCFASDQYALGIVVYEWLCGARPFEGSAWELVNLHETTPPPPLQEKDSSISEAVESVVLKALAKIPDQRYASVQHFAQALERASQITLHYDSQATGAIPTLSSLSAEIPSYIFLSASHADASFAARLQSDLQKRGVVIRNEQYERVFDALDQENKRREAIRAADIVVLVVSPSTRSSSLVKEHLRIASMYQRRVVCVWIAGEDLVSLLPEMGKDASSIDVITMSESRYKLALDELVDNLQEGANATNATRISFSTEIEEKGEPRNPYKGLHAFTQDDTFDFFGREALVEELVNGVREGLRQENSPTRLLAVVGPSGSGKSSVVMAGLLPRLKQGTLLKSGEWIYLRPMVPGMHPLEALALTFASHLPDRSLKSIRDDLEDDSARGLHLLASHLTQGSEKKVILFVDQFEEAFNLTASNDERQRFFDLLLTAITERKGPVIVILTLRADFYDRLISSSELGRLISQHQFIVWPMEVDELRAAIKEPAQRPDVQLAFEGDLVGDLLYESRGQAGALPLLQFTLAQLFEKRQGHLLTEQAYREIGGVKGALAKQAEATYLALPSEVHRQLARVLFLRLVDPGINEQDTTRRRAARSELILPDAQQAAILQEVADAFVAARLLTANGTDSTSTVEVSHEALIREWGRLFEWLHMTREDILRQQTISEDATEWQQRGKPNDRLYRGSQLQEAKAWAKRNVPSSNELTFLRAGNARKIRFNIGISTVLILLLSLMSISGWFLTHQPPKPADPTIVTNLSDDGTGSLRWAIANAPTGSTITFAPNLKGTISIQGDQCRQLLISRNLTIRGPGANILAISGGGRNRVFNVAKGASVVLSGLTIKDGSECAGKISGGGGVYNEGSLTVTDCAISKNGGFYGGGISNAGVLTLTSSTVSENTATNEQGSGGGIYNSKGGQLTLNNSTVVRNKANGTFGNNGFGGGIYNSGTLTIRHSVVSNNLAEGSKSMGGGVYDKGSSTIDQSSTIQGNTASIDNDYYKKPK